MQVAEKLDHESFQFWEKAFLAAMQGILANPGTIEPSESVVSGWAKHQADAALAVWRARRAEVEHAGASASN